MTVLSFPGQTTVNASFRVTTDRGSARGAVSSQWFRRPADEKFLSLGELREFVRDRSERSAVSTVESRLIGVRSSKDDLEKLELQLPEGQVVEPTHWAFGQICQTIGAPASYLRSLPAPIATFPIQYGLGSHRGEMVKTFATQVGDRVELRAMTSPTYGRIHDWEIVEAVSKIAGNGTGDTPWKVPGLLDWSSMTYNPFVDVSKDTTTLYASDRDVFLFLVDDTHPIEVGRLSSGEPDLMFRGFYVWNSEVGAKSMGIATMLLRAVCMNRTLWGVEQFNELTIRHSKGGPDRFAREAEPALLSFANSSAQPVIEMVGNAKGAIVATNDEERLEFLGKQGFSKKEAHSIVDRILSEEGHPAQSVWDFVNGITAHARQTGWQDARVDLERAAGKLLAKVA